jgi:large subunit ribosomal protein L22
MVATKTNERPGTRAQVKYVRSSAYKAREVLDLIRGKSYAQASEILTFSERGISNTVLKCLDSAAANAEHNDSIPAEELFVAACYADEGPTLKRWRPRARGRATRIRKRTCHITIIVARYSPAQLDQMRARDEARGGGGRASNAAEARRRRVAQSRAAAEAKAAEEDHDHEGHDHDHEDHDHEGHDHAEATDGDAEAEATDAEAADAEAADADVEATDDAAVAPDVDDDDQTTEAVTDEDTADAGDTEASEGEDK